MGAILHQQRNVAGFAFVNDTDLCVTHSSDQVQQVIDNMQKAVTYWEGLLQVTGRALVPEKCFWYLVDLECANNKWTYKKCYQVPGTISILDMDCRQVTIQ